MEKHDESKPERIQHQAGQEHFYTNDGVYNLEPSTGENSSENLPAMTDKAESLTSGKETYEYFMTTLGGAPGAYSYLDDENKLHYTIEMKPVMRNEGEKLAWFITNEANMPLWNGKIMLFSDGHAEQDEKEMMIARDKWRVFLEEIKKYSPPTYLM